MQRAALVFTLSADGKKKAKRITLAKAQRGERGYRSDMSIRYSFAHSASPGSRIAVRPRLQDDDSPADICRDRWRGKGYLPVHGAGRQVAGTSPKLTTFRHWAYSSSQYFRRLALLLFANADVLHEFQRYAVFAVIQDGNRASNVCVSHNASVPDSCRVGFRFELSSNVINRPVLRVPQDTAIERVVLDLGRPSASVGVCLPKVEPPAVRARAAQSSHRSPRHV